MMEAIKLKTNISNDGILRVQLPEETYGVDCEVIVLYEPRPKMTHEQWEAFINETYGICADDPIERGEQLPYNVRDEID